MALFSSKKAEVTTPTLALMPTPAKVEAKAKGTATHEIVDVGPEVDVTVKWFNGGEGFVTGPDGKDAHVHKSALPTDVDGKRIQPLNGGKAKARIGSGFKDGEYVGPAVATLSVIDRYVPKARA